MPLRCFFFFFFGYMIPRNSNDYWTRRFCNFGTRRLIDFVGGSCCRLDEDDDGACNRRGEIYGLENGFIK